MAGGATRERGSGAKQAEEANGNGPKQKKRRRWRWMLVLVGLAVIVWLLPGIVANTPLLHWIIGKAAADLSGTVTVGSASLGWLSPIEVQGVEVKDAEGKPVLVLPAVESDRTLAGILWNYTRLGRFTLRSPSASIVVRPDGSNVEDLLAKYLTPKEPSPPMNIGFALEIVDAGITVTEKHTGLGWRVEKLGVSIDMSEGAGGPLAVKVSADLPDERNPGKLVAGVKMAPELNEATLSARHVPLAMFRWLCARLSPGTTIAGRLSSELRVAWGETAGNYSANVDVNAEGLSLGTPLLQTDVVQLERFRAGGQVSWQPERVEIKKAAIDCDLGNLALESTVRLGEKGGLSFGSLLRQKHQFNGRVDLARLARLLSATLRLRREVQINSGQVTLSLDSRPEQQGMAWDGQLEAANLTATAAGRPINWQRPISLVLRAHETPAGPVVETLTCESDFLKVHAHGTPEAMAASLSFNLKQLADQLGQLVELGAIQLAGEGWGNLNWTRSPPPQFAADAEIHLRNLQLALPNQPPWREDELVTSLSAKGQTDLGAETRIDAATLTVKAGADQVTAQLAEPVKDLKGGGTWPVRVQARGQLQNWPSRLAAWAPMGNWRLVGAYTVEAECRAAKDRVELREVKLAATPLVVASAWLNINEPQVDARISGSWDRQQRRFQIDPASLNCATLALQAKNVVVAMPEKATTELSGGLSYKGDVARLCRWLSDPARPSTWQVAGKLQGTAHLQQMAGVIRGDATADVAPLVVVDSSGQQFQEPSVRLAARGDYSPQSGVVKIEQLEVVSAALSAKAAGRMAPASGENNAQFDGRIDYDWERLTGLLRPYLGPHVLITGRGSSAAFYHGPLELAKAQAAAGLRWDSINAYGARIGPGELKATMADGVAQIEPLDLAVGQGRIRLAPRLRLAPEREFSLPAGPLAQQIQIDPTMCTSMLKYLAPVLAGVTSARGAFSIELEGCRIPLSDPPKGELAGRFIIHSVEVGPGPMTRELATFFGREAPARLRQESIVQFRMVDGRVYHQGLELMFPELTIRSYGSVGVKDQTLAVMTEMPVPPKWLANNPLAAQALQNQVVRVPLAGTLGNPQLDRRVMEDLTRQFVQRAAQNVIEGELNKQLDRLFGPGKK